MSVDTVFQDEEDNMWYFWIPTSANEKYGPFLTKKMAEDAYDWKVNNREL